MQTFEKSYKAVLLEQLKEAMPNRKIYVSNDLHYKPLENDPNGVVAIIQTGMGTKSAISGYDMNTVPVVINFIIQANYLQELLGALDGIAKENNGMFSEAHYNNEQHYYKTVYATAYPIGAPFDMRTKTDIVRVMTVNWTLTLTYSSNAIIEPSTFKLRVGSTDYDIKYITRYEISSQPNKEQTQYRHDSRISQLLSSYSTVCSLVLLKVSEDSFQTLLRADSIGKSSVLSNNALKLIIDGDVIDIANHTVTEIYENNASVLNLVFMW